MDIPRILDLRSLLQKKSFFLLGPRSTGKSTLIRQQLPEALVFDLLDTEIFYRLSQRPKLIEERIETSDQIIVIDEIQKLPFLLNEVHRLIEKKGNRFLLTGSSSRKIKAKGQNLLGGRAWEARLHPFTSREIPDFDLLRFLNRGGLPHVYYSDDWKEELRSYVGLYLREEIMAEALTRRIDYFTRFLDIMALNNGEELHYQGLSSDSGVPARTIQNYIQILEDTLVGFQVYPFLATRKRKAITRSKFYFFDVGVVNTLAKRGEIVPGSELYGKAFEHFLMMEFLAYISYLRKDLPLQYWRSVSGNEVDLVIGNQWAIEFKSSSNVTDRHLKGLKTLREEGLVKNFAVISHDPEKRISDGIHIYPWKLFLEELWADKIL